MDIHDVFSHGLQFYDFVPHVLIILGARFMDLVDHSKLYRITELKATLKSNLNLMLNLLIYSNVLILLYFESESEVESTRMIILSTLYILDPFTRNSSGLPTK